jgi:hypothetical protein
MKRTLSNVLILMAIWLASLIALGVEVISLGWNTAGDVAKQIGTQF